MADNDDNLTPEQKAAKEAEAAKEVAAQAARQAEIEAAEAEARAAAERLKSKDQKDEDMVNKLVQERLDAELKGIKDKLNSAFEQRDAALKKVAEAEAKEREATLKKLEEDGKHKEAAEMRLAEANAKIAALEKHNTELSRDNEVRDALKGYQFRNDRAYDMAYKEVVANLVRNDKGQWVHRSGISIKDYCEAFSKDEDQSFLFKAKTNSGAGTTPGGKGEGDTGRKTSLFDMSQDEVLKLAREGKIGKHSRF